MDCGKASSSPARRHVVRAARLKLSNERGLTMIEVLVAAVILSLGTAGLMSAFDGGRRATTYAELHDVATQSAEREVQRVTALEWPKIALAPPASKYVAGEAVPTTYLKTCSTAVKLPPHTSACYQYAWETSADVEPLVVGEEKEKEGKKEVNYDPAADPYTFTTLSPGGTSRLTVTVYRYITWVIDSGCEGTSCHSESETANSKRLTVAVEVNGLKQPVVMDTIVNDSDRGEPHPLSKATCLETVGGKEKSGVTCQ